MKGRKVDLDSNIKSVIITGIEGYIERPKTRWPQEYIYYSLAGVSN